MNPYGYSAESTTQQIEREYMYRPDWMRTIVAAGVLSAGAAYMAYLARTNNRGLVIEGIIHLSPSSARVFYGVLAILGTTIIAGGVLLGFARTMLGHRIATTTSGVILSRWPVSRRETFIAFKDIQALKVVEFRGWKLLHVYSKGPRFTIKEGLLPDRALFSEIRWVIERGASESHAQSTRP